MPRYRFSWDNLDAGLLAALCAGHDLAGASPVAWLRETYGARPKLEFVAECWPVLRDVWLAETTGRRERIVTALRTMRLGDLSIDVTTTDGQIAYLRTCRNQQSLRNVVLDEIIEAGEMPHGPTGKPREQIGWEEFTGRLASALAAMTQGQFLIVAVRGTGASCEGGKVSAPYFVQFAQGGELGLRAEAVSNTFLAGSERLTAAQEELLIRSGWERPTPMMAELDAELAVPPSPNWMKDWDPPTPVPYDAVATLAVTTLRDVYRATSPSMLAYRAFDETGPLAIVGLGIEAQPEGTLEVRDIEELLPAPDTHEALTQALLATLQQVSEGQELEPDDDGDYAFRWGSTVVFTRVEQDAPVVRMFAPILSDVQESTALLRAVNDMNRSFRLIKAFWDGEQIVLEFDVPCRPYVGAHVLQALHGLATVADEIDDELQRQFGGRTFFGETVVPPKHRYEEGGYL